VTFTTLAIGYLLMCVVVGLARKQQGSDTLVAMTLAAAMVCVQLAFLLTR
jgi:hypothetical protein